MPFTVTDNEPDVHSKVTIKFGGLLLLRPKDNNMCEIGVSRSSSIHTCQLMLIVNKPNLPATLLRLASGPLLKDLVINCTAPGGFKAFAQDPFDPTQENGNHRLDYRWAIDMSELNPDSDFNQGAHPIATLNDGVLYTSNLSLLTLKPALIKGNLKREPLMLAADLAVSIPLAPGSQLTMSWTSSANPDIVLPRRVDLDPEGTIYTIVLLNDPPITTPTPHDELGLYYKVLEVGGGPIHPNDQWQLIYQSHPKSDEIPCLPVRLG